MLSNDGETRSGETGEGEGVRPDALDRKSVV